MKRLGTGGLHLSVMRLMGEPPGGTKNPRPFMAGSVS